jgi:hypothetical protein
LDARQKNIEQIEGLKTPTVSIILKSGNVYYDLKAAESKCLAKNGELNNDFAYVQSLYRKGFEQYLLDNTDMKKYDKTLQESKLDIIPIKNYYQQEFAQRYSNLGSDYIYLCNMLHIERLSQGDIAFLQAKIDNRDVGIDAGTLELVGRTYLDVLGERRTYSEVLGRDIGAGAEVGYGPDRPGPPFAPADAIVFKVATGFAADSERDAEVVRYIIYDLAPLMEKELSKKLNRTVIVFDSP